MGERVEEEQERGCSAAPGQGKSLPDTPRCGARGSCVVGMGYPPEKDCLLRPRCAAPFTERFPKAGLCLPDHAGGFHEIGDPFGSESPSQLWQSRGWNQGPQLQSRRENGEVVMSSTFSTLPAEATRWRCLFPMRSQGWSLSPPHCWVPQGQGLTSLFLKGSDLRDQRK